MPRPPKAPPLTTPKPFVSAAMRAELLNLHCSVREAMDYEVGRVKFWKPLTVAQQERRLRLKRYWALKQVLDRINHLCPDHPHAIPSPTKP